MRNETADTQNNYALSITNYALIFLPFTVLKLDNQHVSRGFRSADVAHASIPFTVLKR